MEKDIKNKNISGFYNQTSTDKCKQEVKDKQVRLKDSSTKGSNVFRKDKQETR